MYHCRPLVHRLTAFLLLRLVLETLNPLPSDRKCFRMVNGVLVERTVKDVIPALKTNSDGLKKVLDELLKQYKKQQDDMEKWKVRYSCHRSLPFTTALWPSAPVESHRVHTEIH